MTENGIDSKYTRAHPRWIIGPSGPIGIPHPIAATQERNLATSVFTLNILPICVPLRKPVISGKPDPPAHGCHSFDEENKYDEMH